MLKFIFKFFGNFELPDLRKVNSNYVKNILIVRQHNQLGDMLCSVPLFAAIRKKFPEAHITLVAAPINYEILFSDINPYIDKVITYQKAPLKNLFEFYKELKNHKYQIGIVPSTVSISRTSHLINFFSGAEIRVGVKKIDDKFNEMEYLLNVKSDFNWDERKFHQVERNLEVGKQIDCELSDDEKKRVRIHLSEDEIKLAKNFIDKNFPDKNKLILSFHPGAGKIPNRWGVDNFVNLIEMLYKKYSCYILITSGKIDIDVTLSLKDMLNKKNIHYIIVENTSIRNVGAIIKETDLYITNDTGTMHVAGGVDANVLSLFGPTHGYEWAPRGENKIFLQSPSSNINDIPVNNVFEASCDLINKFAETKKYQ